MKRLVLAIGVAVLGTTLAAAPGCDTVGKAVSSKDGISSLAGDWVLKQLGGKDVASLLPAGAKSPNLSIANDGKVSGFGGVNNFTSALNLDKLMKGDFSLGNIASTRMAGPAESMKVESSFLDSLSKATGFSLDNGGLTLKKGAEALMTFVKGG